MVTNSNAISRAAKAIVALMRELGEDQAIVTITFKGDSPQITITGIGEDSS